MKTKLILLLCLFTANLCIAQKQTRRAYTTIKEYKKLINNQLTKKDLENSIIRGNDTLILISGKEFYKEGVSVKYQPKDSTFLELYKDVVYQKYRKTDKKTKHYMRLWRKPIKIFFSESLDDYYKKEIIKTANILSSQVDSLTISFVDKLEKSNYIIYQIDSLNTYKYSNKLSKNKYVDYYVFWKNNKIYDSKLELNLITYNNIDKKINANYLKQQFFKSLGYFNTTTKLPCYDILSDCNSGNKVITSNNLDILKYHYSFGISKGTDLETFEKNHKKAIETYKKTGTHMLFKHID
ncbi:hypothetical protein LPB136_05915 [Tenacibaculum todarodis]|uniref:Uncharacterized protein n=1 Tax=Tenacibaculum todarodis TaxID=1850252 RepID=A0A1L3JIJ3_9FLAO|nr:hypothetical protein [Tenacibaculum todarodis]APG64922.1 hypothetical protein LPB136_05915 [Tenacibaculum todarodis]